MTNQIANMVELQHRKEKVQWGMGCRDGHVVWIHFACTCLVGLDMHVEPVYTSTLVKAPNVLWKLSVNHIGLAIGFKYLNRLRILER